MWCKEERKFELVIHSNTKNDDSIVIYTLTRQMAIMSSAAGDFILHVLEICEIPIDSQVNNTWSGQRKNSSEDLWACDGE